MLFKAYGAAFKALKKNPFKLLGLTIICMLLGGLFIAMFSPLLIVVGYFLMLVLSVGLYKVYADSVRDLDVNSDQLFAAFKRFWNVAGGLIWYTLWRLIWICLALLGGAVVFGLFYALGGLFSFVWWLQRAFVVIGIINAVIVYLALFVIAIYKIYQYSFFMFIIAERDDVSFTQALRLSIEMTKGKVIQMFLADLLFYAAIFTTTLILALFCLIPYVGYIFMFITAIFLIAVALFGSVFHGLYMASFYVMPAGSSKLESKLDSAMTGVSAKVSNVNFEKNEDAAPADASDTAAQEQDQ